MANDGYKYSAEGSTRGAVQNKYIWTKVKLKNTARYVAIACVILGFYHLFAVIMGFPMSQTWLSIAGEFASAIDQHLMFGNFSLAVLGSIYVWFGP